MSLILDDVSKFITSKVETSNIDETNYVSTENMLPNKGGVSLAASLPDTKSVRHYLPDDILINNIRPYFKKIWFANKEGGCSNDVFVLRANENYDSKFLYYVLSSDDFFSYVMANAKGTKMPRGDKKAIQNYIVPDFSIKDQITISHFLSNIDKKIEINKKINKNLINISKSIFRQKFLNYEGYEDFKDTDYGRIPSTFDVFTLNEISKEIVCGKTPSTKVEDNYGDKMPFITIPDMHNNVFIIETERKLSEKGIQSQKKKTLPKNSICVSCIATAGLVSLTYEESQTNQQINSIICKDNISPYFMYLYLNELSEYIKMLGSGGSTTLNLNKNEFSKIKVAIPNNGDMNKFNDLIEPIFNKIKFNQLEIIELTKLRDTLLPKLMNGEINVSKINCDLD